MLVCARSHPPGDPILALIPRCKSLREAAQVHARLITTGLLRDPSAAAHLVLRLCYSPHPPLCLLARRIFFSLPDPREPFLWNALIKSSSHGPDPERAFLTFALMLFDGVTADKFSFSLALKACSRISSLKEGAQIHSLMLKSKLGSKLYLQNSLIGFYSKCGLPYISRQIFDRIPQRDSVSWNSMIDGYVKAGMMAAAQELFERMGDGERNLTSWNSMIGGYARSLDGIVVARDLFERMPERDSISWNLMIDGYVKCGRMADAVELFEHMPEKDVISWASIIAGYVGAGCVGLARHLFDEMRQRDVITWNIMIDGYIKNGRFTEALCLFDEMRSEGDVAPDSTTLATALSAISELARISDGVCVHEYIERNHLSLDGKLGVALINMYSKCGCLENALKVFKLSRGSVDHWNAVIGGLAIHGFGELALRLFEEMERNLLRPDDITFISVLNACSHAGLVEEGLMLFDVMRRDYRLEPKVQHYGCVIDILGRAGKLEEAWNLIESMPIEPNDVVWRSLLSACRSHGNIDMGQKVVKNLVEGGSFSSSSYLLLANIYAGCGMWGEAGKIRMAMRERDMRKIPGCSWIEIGGSVHEFVVGDILHPQAEDIYSFLEKLSTFELYSVQSSHDKILMVTA